jgi:UDPglucose 6-dehydrogenase
MITVFGLGFVGLTTALGFANYGFKVYGIDIDIKKKETIRSGNLPFLEGGLDQALINNLNKTFFIEDNVKAAIEDSEIIFYCVGTPYGQNGEADLTYLFSAIDETIKYLDYSKKMVLTIKSTIPPSTTVEKIIPYIEKKGIKIGEDIFVANNPEFLREGHCWEDFIEADRIVIGCDYKLGAEKLKEIYQPFNIPIKIVNPNTGEFIKYLSNTLLATLISYSNEMAEIAEVIGGIQVSEAFRILHLDKRWNDCNMSSYAYPGCGYGGYCLPKDTNALYAIAKEKGGNPAILGNVIMVNEEMPEIVAKRIIKKIDSKMKIGILGLSFKPGSDDVRDCASAKVIRELIKLGYHNIMGYDPVAINEFKRYYDLDIEYIEDIEVICKKADELIILTAWEEFRDVKIKYENKTLDFRYM